MQSVVALPPRVSGGHGAFLGRCAPFRDAQQFFGIDVRPCQQFGKGGEHRQKLRTIDSNSRQV
jgi:hypothetical protein